MNGLGSRPFSVVRYPIQCAIIPALNYFNCRSPTATFSGAVTSRRRGQLSAFLRHTSLQRVDARRNEHPPHSEKRPTQHARTVPAIKNTKSNHKKNIPTVTNLTMSIIQYQVLE